MINNTLTPSYTGLLKPNPKAVNPFANPAQSALNSKVSGNVRITSGPLEVSGGGFGKGILLPNGSRSVGPNGVGGYDTAVGTNIPQTQTKGLVKAPVGNIADTPVDMTNANVNLQTQTGNAPSGTPSSSQNQNGSSISYPGLVNLLLNAGSQAKSQQAQTADQISQLQNDLQEKTGLIMNDPQELNFQTGRINALQTQEQAKEANLQNKLSSQIAANNQNIGAIESAAGLASPQLAGFNQQVFNPLTGGLSSGGSLQDAVSNVVGKLTRGEMSYNDAVSALSGYGQGGVNALQSALPPGFNIAQSNALAGQQGTIGPALQYATSALNNLKSAFNNLHVPGQQSNVPLIGGFSNWLSQQLGFGKTQTTNKEGALAESRQAIQTVLASVKGGTPTDYTEQSHSILPDNATPADVDAAIQLLNTLGSTKQNIYGNPGQSNQNQNAGANNTNSSIYSF